MQTDKLNCGGCSKACPTLPNAVPGCSKAACGVEKCAADWADCDGRADNGCEIKTTNDVKNCGGCGKVCPKDKPLCVESACIPHIWALANYDGGTTAWNAGREYNGTVNCAVTCNAQGLRAIGVRFICNLHGQPAAEGCDDASDGKYGNENCDVWIDAGTQKTLSLVEDCAKPDIKTCLTAPCSEAQSLHALQCQCTL